MLDHYYSLLSDCRPCFATCCIFYRSSVWISFLLYLCLTVFLPSSARPFCKNTHSPSRHREPVRGWRSWNGPGNPGGHCGRTHCLHCCSPHYHCKYHHHNYWDHHYWHHQSHCCHHTWHSSIWSTRSDYCAGAGQLQQQQPAQSPQSRYVIDMMELRIMLQSVQQWQTHIEQQESV